MGDDDWQLDQLLDIFKGNLRQEKGLEGLR